MLPSGIESFRTMQREAVIIESDTSLIIFIRGCDSAMEKTRLTCHYTTLFRCFTT